MARDKHRWARNSNYDRRDGLKVNRISENSKVSNYHNSVSMFDVDNVMLDTEKGFMHVSIAGKLRWLNRLKCNRINGYKGKLNGRE